MTAPLRNSLRTVALLALLAFPALAQAQGADPSGNRAAAQVLFEAGREAMDAQDYKQACAKFQESQRLDPAAGTLLNLGNCEERLGRVASAWERYRGAIKELEPGDRRYQFAQQKIEELKQTVPHLTVSLDKSAPENTQVWRNDTPLSGSLGIALPMNPGEYEIVVEAPGFKAQVIKVKLALGDQQTLTVKPGEKLQVQTTNTDPKAKDRPTDSDGLSQTTWGYVVGGVGVAGLTTALAMGTLAWTKKAAVDENCPGRNSTEIGKCRDAKSVGKSAAQIANVAGIVGGIALGVGAYLILTDSSEETAFEAGSFQEYSGVRFRGVF